MARARIVVTDVWTQIATGRCMFTVDVAGTGSLLFNETASDVTAVRVYAPNPGAQMQQGDELPTFVRQETGNRPFELIADGVL
jgi:hypothetical protein